MRVHGDLRLAWYLRPLFWLQRRRWGQELLPARTWARLPPLYLALLHFYAAIERRGALLEPALRSLVQARVSQLNHCEFCVDLNVSLAAERSGSMDKALAAAAWRESALFSERERAALAYAEAVSRSLVTDDHFAQLRQHFTEDAIVELTALAAFQNMSAKFNAALDIPPQGFCRLPPGKTP
ncbi:MAG: carboxymuconolactone decarboxylase family protein [Pseudomonadota bacterium]